MSYAEIKAEIEQKTKQLMEGNLTEKQKESINIDLERVLQSLIQNNNNF